MERVPALEPSLSQHSFFLFTSFIKISQYEFPNLILNLIPTINLILNLNLSLNLNLNLNLNIN